MSLFIGATMVPLPLLAAGAVWGGIWIAAAWLYLTFFAFAVDELVAHATPDAPEGAEFPAADPLSAALGLAHFVLLPLGIWAVVRLDGWEGVLAFLAFGVFFGQVSHPNAHELIHRSDRWLFRLGMAVYTSLLIGHHTSAHRLVHHRFVASGQDPNSAPLGQSFYAFAPRAWIGSFRAGLAMENDLQARAKGFRVHPYAIYIAGGIGCALAAWLAFGLYGLAAYLGLAAYAQVQILLADYVQHYGLQRRAQPNGRLEPVGPQHSWNSPHWFSSYLMLNAPRHSDHHAHPNRQYPALHLPEPAEAPTLPYSLPVMGTVALLPSVWRRMMDRRVVRWQGGPHGKVSGLPPGDLAG